MLIPVIPSLFMNMEYFRIMLEFTTNAKDFPNKKATAIVADGGMKDHSDIIKSLALFLSS